MPGMLRNIMIGAAALASAEVFFEEDFSNGMDKWVEGKMPGKEMGKWDITPGKWFVDEQVNKGLTTTEYRLDGFSLITSMLKNCPHFLFRTGICLPRRKIVAQTL